MKPLRCQYAPAGDSCYYDSDDSPTLCCTPGTTACVFGDYAHGACCSPGTTCAQALDTGYAVCSAPSAAPSHGILETSSDPVLFDTGSCT